MRKIGLVRSASLTTSLTQIIGPSEHRTALMFSPPNTGGLSYTVSTDPTATLGAGLNLTADSGQVLLTEEVFGDAVKKAWFAIGSSVFTIGFLETIVE